MIAPETIGYIGIGSFFIFLMIGMPIGGALALIGFLGYWMIVGVGPSLAMLGMAPYQHTAVYAFSVLPLFIIMGYFAYYAGFPRDLFNTAQRWVGRIPGGLVQSTIAGAAAFGACCGSGLASCAVVAKVSIPEMINQGVDRPLAFGAVAGAGTIAAMIPPSVIMVIYGIITHTPIGKLLIAGIIPGIVAAVNYMIMVWIRVKLNPGLVPQARSYSWRERFSSVRNVWGFALMVFIVLGGIYAGIFTPTEAGAVGAFGMFVLALAMRRLNFSNLGVCLLDTVRATGSVTLIVVGAFIFGYFLSVSRLPTILCGFLVTVDAPPIVVLIGIMLFYVILGTFMDNLAAMFITLPIIFPAIVQLGFDPIWFGVLMVHIEEIALVTPPYGLNLFIIKGVIPEAKTGEIMRGVGYYLLMDIITLALFISFPQLSLFLPSLMK